MWDKIIKEIDCSITPQRAAALWDADKGSLKLIHNGIHLVYYFEVKKQGKYLRITHPHLRSQNEIASAIDYQNYLFQQKVPVCRAVLSRHGRYIEKVLQNSEMFLVHVINAVPGTTIFLGENNLVLYERWGKSIARLHKVSQQYRPEKKFYFKTWKNVWDEVARYIPSEEKRIQKEYRYIDRFFKKLPCSTDDFGLTHNDHHSKNVLYDEKQICIIDFDFPLYHWFMADIVRPFLPLCHKDFSEWESKFNQYLQSYSSILLINKVEIKFAAWFIRMRALEMYVWTKNNWGGDIASGGGSTDK